MTGTTSPGRAVSGPGMSTGQATSTPDRKTRCRYTRMNGDQCQNEAISATEDVVLCAKHTMRAHHVWLRYYKAAMAKAR